MEDTIRQRYFIDEKCAPGEMEKMIQFGLHTIAVDWIFFPFRYFRGFQIDIGNHAAPTGLGGTCGGSFGPGMCPGRPGA
ncbi:hypothetical protein ABID25_006568 [Mesorhizobium abyssinicae]